MVTLAPTMAAPVGSVTSPVIVPETAWPKAVAEVNRRKASRTVTTGLRLMGNPFFAWFLKLYVVLRCGQITSSPTDCQQFYRQSNTSLKMCRQNLHLCNH